MIKKYFGTDGIRGKVNKDKINGEMFFKFGLAAGTYFKNQKKKKTNCNNCKRHQIIWIYFRTSLSIWANFSRNACFYAWPFAYKWFSNADKKNECKHGNYDNCFS